MRSLAAFVLFVLAVPGAGEEPADQGCPDPAAWAFVKTNYPDPAQPDPEAFFRLDPETRRRICDAASSAALSLSPGGAGAYHTGPGLSTADKKVDVILKNKDPFGKAARSEDMPGGSRDASLRIGRADSSQRLNAFPSGMKTSEFRPQATFKPSIVPTLTTHDPRSGSRGDSSDLVDLLALSSAVREERIRAGHPLGTLGNMKNSVYTLFGKKVADGSGSGCRDWAEAVAERINRKEGQRFTAGVICGGVPVLLQHCVTAVYPKGRDPNDPSTPVRYIDAWQKKGIRTGPIRDFLCGYGLLAIKQDTSHWAFGANPEGSDHTIALYDQEVPFVDASGKPVLIKGKPQTRSISQVNIPFNRTCLSK